MTSTTFYSTKRSQNVSVPNSRVCGYRMSNPIMKKGYSDGVRSGSDNGVVNQNLSRFATENEREDAGSTCAGNVNWLNYVRGNSFRPSESVKNQFNIDRKGFIAGSLYNQKNPADGIDNINKRKGIGNYEITRPSFLAAPIRGRSTVDFDKLQAMDIAEFGQKVRLGEDQLNKFIMVEIPDMDDTQWTAEKKRMIAVFKSNGLTDKQILSEFRVNKPLGRDQRTISKPSNNLTRIRNMSFSSKLAEIKQEIDAGRATDRKDQALLLGQLATMLDRQSSIEQITTGELRTINQTLKRLKMPADYKSLFGAENRVVSGTSKFFKENKGLLMVFLLSNLPPGRNYDTPLESWGPKLGRYSLAGITMLSKMPSSGNKDITQKLYLDLETRTIDTVASLALKGLTPPVDDEEEEEEGKEGAV